MNDIFLNFFGRLASYFYNYRHFCTQVQNDLPLVISSFEKLSSKKYCKEGGKSWNFDKYHITLREASQLCSWKSFRHTAAEAAAT